MYVGSRGLIAQGGVRAVAELSQGEQTYLNTVQGDDIAVLGEAHTLPAAPVTDPSPACPRVRVHASETAGTV